MVGSDVYEDVRVYEPHGSSLLRVFSRACLRASSLGSSTGSSRRKLPVRAAVGSLYFLIGMRTISPFLSLMRTLVFSSIWFLSRRSLGKTMRPSLPTSTYIVSLVVGLCFVVNKVDRQFYMKSTNTRLNGDVGGWYSTFSEVGFSF